VRVAARQGDVQVRPRCKEGGYGVDNGR